MLSEGVWVVRQIWYFTKFLCNVLCSIAYLPASFRDFQFLYRNGLINMTEKLCTGIYVI